MRHRIVLTPRRANHAVVALCLAASLCAPCRGAAFTAEDLLNVAIVSDTVPSPDGARVAYVAARADTSVEPSTWNGQLFVAADAAARRFSSGPGSVSRPRWSPRGDALAYLQSVPGKAGARLMLIPSDGGAPRALTTADDQVSAFEWAPDGRTIAVLRPEPAPPAGPAVATVVDEGGGNTHLWLIDVDRERALRQLTAGDFNIGNALLGEAFDWSPDGRFIAFTRTRSAALDDWTSADVAVVAVDSGAVRQFQQSDAAEYGPRYSPDGDRIAFHVTVFPPSWIRQARVGIANTDGSGVKLLAATEDEQPRIVGWISGRMLLVEEARGTTTALWTLPIKGGAPRRFDDGDAVLSSVNLNAPGTRLAFVSQSADAAPEAAVTALRRFRPETVSRANANAPALPAVTTRTIDWPAPDGTIIEGLLTLPAGHQRGQRHPLLLLVHGGPAGVFSNDYLGNPRGAPLAPLSTAGYALLRVNPRGSSGYGHALRAANRGDWGGADYLDLMSGVDHVIESGVADADRLGVMGWSYGGYMSAWIISQSHRFGGAVIGAPVTDLANLAVTTDIPGFLPDYFAGEFWQAPAAYAARSPLLAAGDVTTPALVLHGEADRRVPMAQGLALYRALQRQGLDVRMVSYPRAGHVLNEPAQLVHAARETLAWFERHVPVR